MTDIHCPGDYRRAEAEIVRLNGLVDQLTYERDHYRRELCQVVDADRAIIIQEAFGFTVEESLICAALYQRRERWLSGTNLGELLDESRGGSTEASLVSQSVTRIRRKLGDDAIENARGRGYRLSAALLKQLDRKLRRAA